MTQELELFIEVPSQDIQLGSPFQVSVRLHNPGPEPVLVNPRMAVGYRGHLVREIFVDLINASGQSIQVDEIDYNRDFYPSERYELLSPGDTISTSFDLFEWYLPKTPGVYDLVVHYQADEELADPPEGAIEGIISSKPTQINIRPPAFHQGSN